MADIVIVVSDIRLSRDYGLHISSSSTSETSESDCILFVSVFIFVASVTFHVYRRLEFFL